MAKKQLQEKVFKPEPVKKIKTPTTFTTGENPAECKFDVKLDTWTKPVSTPSEFLTSKGFQQVHQGQRIYATFEQIHELLKEYRAL